MYEIVVVKGGEVIVSELFHSRGRLSFLRNIIVELPTCRRLLNFTFTFLRFSSSCVSVFLLPSCYHGFNQPCHCLWGAPRPGYLEKDYAKEPNTCGLEEAARTKRYISSIKEISSILTSLSGYPILGSVLDVPEELGWIKFSDWGKEFGPIYQCNLAGTNHVWISSDQIAKDLLSKKAAIYSDRPNIPALLEDNRTSGQYLPLMSNNDHWTRQRKFANTIMRESEKNQFHQYPEMESIRMCAELMKDPSQYNHAQESFISRVTCRLAWGHSEASDELKERARELLIGVSPTGSMINKLPFLMSLPDWLSPAKAWERKRARTERRFFEIMQGQVRSDMLTAEQSPQKTSWMSIFLGSKDRFNFSHDLEGAYAVGMHGIAGALTIAAVMQGFCLAMCHYPQYLEMLQEELDAVCGERMPTNADKPSLPMLRAIIKETIRWRPPVPTGSSFFFLSSSLVHGGILAYTCEIGIPHFLIQDDEYNGYHIPKGSVIHPLEWYVVQFPFHPIPQSTGSKTSPIIKQHTKLTRQLTGQSPATHNSTQTQIHSTPSAGSTPPSQHSKDP